MAKTSFRPDANLDTYGSIIAMENKIRDNTEQINKNEREINQLLAQDVDVSDKRIKQLQQENIDLKEQSLVIGEILNQEDVQAYKQNKEQQLDNDIELITAGENDTFNNLNIFSIDALEEAIEQGALGESIKSKFAALGPEAADAFLLEVAATLSEADLSNVHISLEDIQLQETLNKSAQAFTER